MKRIKEDFKMPDGGDGRLEITASNCKDDSYIYIKDHFYRYHDVKGLRKVARFINEIADKIDNDPDFN